MPRYELIEGKSSKFWQIEKSKNAKGFTITFGRIGTDGQTQTKKFADEWKANGEYTKLVDEKLGKGYRIAGGGTRAKPAVNRELEAAIAEDPSDVQRWLVWADWLQQAGDPRGELVTLRAAKKKTTAYEAKHASALWSDALFLTTKQPFAGRTFTGSWTGAKPEPYEALAVELERDKLGFVETATFTSLDEEGHMAGAVGALLEAPLGRFVRTLRFELVEQYEGPGGQPHYGHVVAAIARAQPTTLRELVFENTGYQRSWTTTGDLGQVWPHVPYLETLSIDIGNIELGKKIDLPRLRTLRLETGGLAANNVKAIAAAKWPALEELVLYFGTPRYGGNATVKDVKALLAGSFPKLRRLALCNAEGLQSAIAAELVKSPLVKQLETVDLSKGTLHDEDTALLVASADRMKHVKTIDVGESYFSADSEAALRKAYGKRIVLGGQRYDEMVRDRAEYGDADWARKQKETFRYASIGE